jgi:hypothetical protein
MVMTMVVVTVTVVVVILAVINDVDGGSDMILMVKMWW